MTVGWQDEQDVVTFGRLYLNSLGPTRYRPVPVHHNGAAKATWTSRLLKAVNAASRLALQVSKDRKGHSGQRQA